MSDAGAVPIDAIPPLPRPPTRADRVAAFVRTGWRPFAGWTCGLILLVQGVGLPIAARVFHFENPPLSWPDLAVFTTPLVGLGVARSLEKCLGAST